MDRNDPASRKPRPLRREALHAAPELLCVHPQSDHDDNQPAVTLMRSVRRSTALVNAEVHGVGALKASG